MAASATVICPQCAGAKPYELSDKIAERFESALHCFGDSPMTCSRYINDVLLAEQKRALKRTPDAASSNLCKKCFDTIHSMFDTFVSNAHVEVRGHGVKHSGFKFTAPSETGVGARIVMGGRTVQAIALVARLPRDRAFLPVFVIVYRYEDTGEFGAMFGMDENDKPPTIDGKSFRQMMFINGQYVLADQTGEAVKTLVDRYQ